MSRVERTKAARETELKEVGIYQQLSSQVAEQVCEERARFDQN
jgi:hypothetical protein